MAVCAILRVEADADAGGDGVAGLAIKHEWQGKLVDDALGGDGSSFPVGARDQNGEFVAAQAGGGVGGARALLDARGRLQQ